MGKVRLLKEDAAGNSPLSDRLSPPIPCHIDGWVTEAEVFSLIVFA